MTDTPNRPPLSDATQAVWSAFEHADCDPYVVGPRKASLAAALRAAADQVVPNNPRPSADSHYHLMQWSKSLDQYEQRQQTRHELLAIAANLENAS